ncbi:MAG: hypothetical protein M3Y37_11315, partial [Chloroflexota bacterium]|nr:hypothetical protein [Chloroflexota bacterium]
MSRRAGGYLAILLSLGVALAAVLGPLVLEVIEFRLGENAITQFRGGEIVSLAIVAPLLIVAGALWLRGHPLAPVLAIGPALYAAYTYTSAVLGQEYARYEGNVEKFYPLFAGLVLGGLVVAMLSWMWLAEEPASARPYAAHRALAWAFIILGAFFALTWAAQIRLVYTGDPPEEYNEGPTLFWLIKFLDFALCIPVLIATGIGLRRGVATA